MVWFRLNRDGKHKNSPATLRSEAFCRQTCGSKPAFGMSAASTGEPSRERAGRQVKRCCTGQVRAKTNLVKVPMLCARGGSGDCEGGALVTATFPCLLLSEMSTVSIRPLAAGSTTVQLHLTVLVYTGTQQEARWQAQKALIRRHLLIGRCDVYLPACICRSSSSTCVHFVSTRNVCFKARFQARPASTKCQTMKYPFRSVRCCHLFMFNTCWWPPSHLQYSLPVS